MLHFKDIKTAQVLGNQSHYSFLIFIKKTQFFVYETKFSMGPWYYCEYE